MYEEIRGKQRELSAGNDSTKCKHDFADQHQEDKESHGNISPFAFKGEYENGCHNAKKRRYHKKQKSKDHEGGSDSRKSSCMKYVR